MGALSEKIKGNQTVKEILQFWIIFFAIYVIWIVAFGWNAEDYLLNQDGFTHHLITIKKIYSVSNLIPFDFGNGGGIPLYPVTGLIDLEWMLTKLGVDIVTAANLTLIFFQATLVYFTVRWLNLFRRLYWSDFYLSILLMAFGPVLMFRVTAGHINLIIGSTLVSLFLFSATLLRRNKTASLFTYLLLCFCLSQIFCYIGYQTAYYAFILALPAALYLAFYRRKAKFDSDLLKKTVAIFAGTAALSFLEVVSNFGYLLSSENSRGLGGKSILFSYFQPDLQIWRASLFHSLEAIPSGIPSFLFHEISYPSLLILAVFLAAWRFNSKAKRLIPALIFVPGLVLFLSTFNLPVFTPLVVKLLPGFGAFRVPQRFMMPWIFLILCFIILRFRLKEKISPREFLITLGVSAGAGCLFYFSDSEITVGLEVILVLTAGASLALKAKIRRWVVLGVLSSLVGISFAADYQRKPKFMEVSEASLNRYNVNETLKLNPLRRSNLNAHTIYEANAGIALNAGSLTFYSHPNQNFLNLVATLYPRVDPTTMIFNPAQFPEHLYFEKLYNVVDTVSFVQGEIHADKLREPSDIRFPTISRNASDDEVRALSRENASGQDEYIYKTLDTGSGNVFKIDPACGQLSAQVAKATVSEIEFKLTPSSSSCYAVLPLNFSKLYSISTETENGESRRVEPLLSHRALVALPLAPKTVKISVKLIDTLTDFKLLLEKLFGLVVCLGLYRLLLRKQAETAQNREHHAKV